MQTSKIATAGIALLATALVALTGCSYPGDDEDRAAFHADAQGQQPPATSAPSTEPETPAEETGDDGTENDGHTESTSESVDLSVEEGQVAYIRAIQAFSPELERWVLDQEAGEVTYSLRNCLGQTQSEGVATLEHQDGGDDTSFEAKWIGGSPIENVAAESILLEITDDTLTNFSEVATSRTDIETGSFTRMCADAGETAAEFIF
ncbi:MAG: hypothetical protein ACTH07_05745 [Microbacterium sp.]